MSTPPALQPEETRYVSQLLAVYRERHPDDGIERNTVHNHPHVGEHFDRQRLIARSAPTLARPASSANNTES